MLGARCVHMILQAEHALLRERLDALSAHLRFGRADAPGAEAEWPREWQDRLAALIQLDRARHQPKVGRLCGLLESTEAAPALARHTLAQELEERQLAQLQLLLISPLAELSDAATRLIDQFSHWRTALLDRLQAEQRLLHLADRLLNRDDWSVLASVFSRLTCSEAGLAASAGSTPADSPVARLSAADEQGGHGTTGAVRRIWPMRVPASVRRLPQAARAQDAERPRARSVPQRLSAVLRTPTPERMRNA